MPYWPNRDGRLTDQSAYLAEWGLGDAPCHLIAARENQVFRIETPDGPAALRLHRAGYRSRAALRSELDWMAELARGGLSVPTPRPTPDGRLCVEADGVVADILSWVNGAPMGADGRLAPLDEAPATYRALGREMARLHDLSDAWTLPEGFVRPRWDLDGFVGDTPLWGRFWDNPLLTCDQAARLAEARDLAREKLTHGAPTDFGLIHADLVPENVILSEGGPVLIDFDDGGWGYRAFDLATVANRALRETGSAALIDALLDGYTSRRLFDPADLPLFQALRSFTYVGWIIPRLREAGAEARAIRFIAMADRMARQLIDGTGERYG